MEEVQDGALQLHGCSFLLGKQLMGLLSASSLPCGVPLCGTKINNYVGVFLNLASLAPDFGIPAESPISMSKQTKKSNTPQFPHMYLRSPLENSHLGPEGFANH